MSAFYALFPVSYYYSEDFSAAVGGDEWLTNVAYGRANGTLTTEAGGTGMSVRHTHGGESVVTGTFEGTIPPEFTFSGDTNWTLTGAVFRSGASSIRSGYIPNSYSSSLQITAKGPAQISFWWRPSSAANDWVKFYVNGACLASNSGNPGTFNQVTINIPSGNNVLMWSYIKDAATTAGNDCVYLDDLTGVTNAGTLSFSRSCNPGAAARVGYWIGRYAINTNTFSANGISPFGVEAVRTYAWLDYLVHNNATQDLSRHSTVGMWLIDDAYNIPKIQAETGNDADFWRTFANSIEFCNEVGVWGTTDRRRYIAYYENSLVGLDLSNAVRPDGRVMNIADVVNFDYRIDDTLDYGYGIGNGMPCASNIGFRMVHNGNAIEFLVNPNPRGDNTLPNEWMSIGQRSVIWSNNIQFMFGNAQKTADYRYTGGYTTAANGPARSDANFDDVLVRSAANRSVITFTPSGISPSVITQAITLVISNDFLTGISNAGVNYLRITKPNRFVWNTDFTNTNAFAVTTRYDGTTHVLTNGWFDYARFPANNEAAIMTNFQTNTAMSNEIRIVLGDQISNTGFATNGVIEVRMQVLITNDDFTADAFTVHVTAEQFDTMPPSKKGAYATTGWQKCEGNGTLSAITAPPDGQAAISPSSINYITGTSNSFSLTYYIQATNGGHHSNITYAAITIPYAFTNCSITDLKSIYITNSASLYRTNLLNITNLEGSSNVIFLDYSGKNITLGGLDVISFKVNGSPAAGGTNEWLCYADTGTLMPTSPIFRTNVFYPTQNVGVETNKLTYPWDYQIVNAGNSAPVSIGVSNIIPMGWIDLVADGESPGVENITGFDVTLGGKKADIYGQLLVYRHTNGTRLTFSTNNFALVASSWITSPNAVTTVSFANETNQSTDPVYPTRYWVALFITNTATPVFTNTIMLTVSNVTAGGLVDQLAKLTNSYGNATSRVDTHTLYALVENAITSNVKQGSFNNPCFKLTLSNADPDATNYFSQLIVTNTGTVNQNDLGFLKLFIDTNGMGYSVSNKVVMAVGMNGSTFTLSSATPVALTGTTPIVFWGAYDVDLNARVTNTARLVIATNTAFSFSDPFNDGSDPRPAIVPFAGTQFPMATNAYAAVVIPYDSQPYDFYLQTASYASMPQAFSTNQLVPVGTFSVFKDTENTNTEIFNGIDVILGTSSSKADINGIAYLYSDTNADGVFSTADELVASNAVIAGSPFLINCTFSNVSANQFAATKFFLTFLLTNDITSARSNTVSFQVTNLRCSGPNGGIFSNLSILSNVSRTARVDSGSVVVSEISNYITSVWPRQGSFNNTLLKITLSGDDADATNYLSYIDVRTNGLSSVLDTQIPALKLFADTNNDGIFSNDQQVAVNSLTAGTAHLALASPFVLAGTNRYSFFVGFDVSSDDTNAVGRSFGLLLTNAAFGFSDTINDGFTQLSFASGATVGPAIESNVTISALTARAWDFKVTGASNYAPVSIAVSNTYAMSFVDIVADGENPALERITNISFTLAGNTPNTYGIASIYLDTNDASRLSNDLLITNIAVTAPGATNAVSLILTNLSTDLQYPSRVWLAFMVTNGASAVWSNTVRMPIVDLTAAGPNAGFITNKELATNLTANTARIDRYRVDLLAASLLTNTVKQGSFNNLCFSLTITNADPDAVYSLAALVITNSGTASNSDLGSLQIYRDNNDGSFDPAFDTLVSSANMTAGKTFNAAFNPVLSLSGASNTLWAVVSAGFSAAVGNTIALRIEDASNTVQFADTFNDDYTLTPVIATAPDIPTVLTTNSIIIYSAQPYDFYLISHSYSTMPQSFSTNQYVPVGSVNMFMDNENAALQAFRGMDVHLTSTKTKTDINGVAYLYRDTNSDGAWSLSDQLLASNAVLAGADFSLNCALSNLSVDGASPERMFLVFRMTNALTLAAQSNTVSFMITNLRCDGPNGGIFTNVHILTNGSVEARVDGGKVTVSIANYFQPASPSRSSFDNRYLMITLRGDDPDALHSLSSLRVITNNNCTLSPIFIPKVSVFDALGTLLGMNDFSSGDAIVTFPAPATVTGTNDTVIYVGFNVSTSLSVTNKNFGLMITNGAFTFSDTINDNFPQTSYAVNDLGPAFASSVTIKDISQYPWDLNVNAAGNTAPASIGTTNIFAIGYFEVSCDPQESQAAQILTNCIVTLEGAKDIRGELRLYRDTNGSSTNFAFTGEKYITNATLSTPAVNGTTGLWTFTNSLSFSENMLAQYPGSTRFWVALSVTNTNTAVIFTNMVRARIIAIDGIGPDGGTNAVVSNPEVLTNIGTNMGRIDSYRVAAFMYATNGMNVSASSFGNNYGALAIVSEDTDSMTYLAGLTITNIGSATASDLGAMRVFKDDGDGVYSNSDTLVLSASLSANAYRMSTTTPIALTGRTNVFWVTYDVTFDAFAGNAAAFRIAAASDIVFTNGINDGYNRTALLTNTGPYPAASASNTVIPLVVMPFDYNILGANYTMMPEAFTTNQFAAAGYISLYRDQKPAMTQFITNMYVDLFSTGTKSNSSGMIYLYRDTNYDGNWSLADKLIGSNWFTNGVGTYIECDPTDVITPNVYVPDRIFTVLRITNDIDTVKNDRIACAITNFEYMTVGGGKTNVTNTFWLTNRSPEARVDSTKLVILTITNDMVNYFPNQGSAHNPYLKIQLRGDDADAVNKLSYVDIAANALCAVDVDTIQYLVMYTNHAGVLQLDGSAMVTPPVSFDGTAARLSFPVPYTIAGSNLYDFYIGYFVSGSTNVINKRFGIQVTNGSFGFTPSVSNANFTLAPVISGQTSGPIDVTNVKIRKLGAYYWDENLVFSRNRSPALAVASDEVPILSFDAYRENEIPAEPEYLSGIVITNLSSGGYFHGFFNIYTNRKTDESYTNGVLIASNAYISNMNAAVLISFSNQNGYDWDNPTRYYLTYTPLSFSNAVTNLFTVVNVLSGGPNLGTTAGIEWLSNLTMTPIALDAASVSIAVTPLMPTAARQGTGSIAAMKIDVSAIDDDASYSLKQLTFKLEENSAASNSIGSAALYLDNGTAGVYDAADTLIDGTTGYFVNGTMTLAAGTALAITSNKRSILLVIKVDDNAKPLGSFRIRLRQSDQTGFIPLTIDGTAHAVAVAPYAADDSGWCAVQPNIVFSGSVVAPTKTLFDPGSGEAFVVYLREDVPAADIPLYKLHIFTPVGQKVAEANFTAALRSASWTGSSSSGIAPSGIYVGIVTGPNGFNRKIKVILRK